jgi:Spy/CpxP family protein refolding chaperone
MFQRWQSAAFATLALLVFAAPIHGQSFGFPWWRDPQFQKELVLSTDQSGKIDAVFQQTIPLLRQQKTDLDAQEEELSQMIATNADEAAVTRQVDKVEAIRSSMNKMRTLMLLHMRQVLSPEQRIKLTKLHEEWQKTHPREHGK